jgi:phosphatidylglycerol:prolipoprotein diacylglycerol transferase
MDVMIKDILNFIVWDPPKEMLPFNLPLLNRPILWYGFFFALGFFIGYWILRYILARLPGVLETKDKEKSLKQKISIISEKMTLYVIMGTIIGARLGDVFFYQHYSTYLYHPINIIKVWEGGLASHGGVIGIFIALYILSKRIRKTYPRLTLTTLTDLSIIPTALVCCCIRIGNFFNQEILGTVTAVPWAIIFKHPADGSAALPRHPVQLYEALFYFLMFIMLTLLFRFSNCFKTSGKATGFFLFFVFLFRFFIEYFKVEQSALLNVNAYLSMGQILSIPLILIGAFLLFRRTKQS